MNKYMELDGSDIVKSQETKKGLWNWEKGALKKGQEKQQTL